ncbi:MAG: SLC13 family permease [Gammaproteobacteria bacterium]
MFGVPGFTPDMLLVFSIIIFVMILFISDLVRVDVVACLIIVVLGLTKLLPNDLLFSGFSSEAVISLIGIMIIGQGLEKSGVVSKIALYMLRIGGMNEKLISLLLMGVGGVLAGFLRSVGSVALFLPVITRIRRTTGIAKARLLMPLGFCAILGSTLTMVGTGPLILLNGLLANVGGLKDASGADTPPFGLFTVLPIGIALLIAGMIYFYFLSRWLLPKIPFKPYQNGGTVGYFKRMYGIGGDFCELRVPVSSPLANDTLEQWETLLDPDIVVIGIKIGNTLQVPPLRKTEIKGGATVACIGPREKIDAFAKKYGLRISPYLTAFKESLNPAQAGLCEAVVPPSSSLVGRDLANLHMRRNFAVQVLALIRGDKVRRGSEMSDTTLRPGDTLGMFCEWAALSELEKNPDFVVVTTDFPREQYREEKMGLSMAFFILSILLVMFSNLPVPISLLVGALGMIFSGVLSIDEAYGAVSWKTVFLLAGLIPLGIAVQTTGAADWLIQQILPHISSVPIIVVQIGLALLATFLSMVISNIGVTVIMVPLAVQMALQLHADPRLFALIIALNASNSFLFPTHQANALISGPGRYRVGDFMKAGSGMTVIYIVIVILGLNFMF